jgi:hypothetical protein
MVCWQGPEGLLLLLMLPLLLAVVLIVVLLLTLFLTCMMHAAHCRWGAAFVGPAPWGCLVVRCCYSCSF